jgi:hypothetical protein
MTSKLRRQYGEQTPPDRAAAGLLPLREAS